MKRCLVVLLSLIVVFALLTILSSAQMKYKEAPMLAELVKAGKLPPVEQRLPKDPMVVKPFERIGQYGGTWRRMYTGAADLAGIFRLTYDPLVRWSPDYEVIPNLSKKWDVSEGGKVFTFYLREGVKWSDGVPFTADDIVFWYEDVLLNKELTPAFPKWLTVGGEPCKIEKVNDYAIKFTFVKPYGLFLQFLATPSGMDLVIYPEHYIKQFHPKYVSKEKLEKMVKDGGFEFWYQLFQNKSGWSGRWTNPDLPTLSAWHTTVPVPADHFVVERNPYYWKVDTAGNQLPYIDRIVHDLAGDKETIVMRAIGGDIDMQGRHIGGVENKSLFLANKEKGDYRLIDIVGTGSVDMVIAPNLNHKDPVMREILNDRRFRIALSHAIDRDEINEIVWLGQGTPRQAAPLPGPYYYEKFEKAYLEYDPDKANKLLDEMGFVKRDAQGFRLRPDGKTLALTIEFASGIFGPWEDACEIIKDHWEKVGIKTALKPEERALFYTRKAAAEHDVGVWGGDGGMECLLEPRWYFPFSSESIYATQWAAWYQTGGKSGEEPPPIVKKQMELYDQILITPDPEEQKKLFRQIIEITAENLWAIGIIKAPPGFYVAKNYFRNLPEKDWGSWMYPNPGPIYPEQFFIEQK